MAKQKWSKLATVDERIELLREAVLELARSFQEQTGVEVKRTKGAVKRVGDEDAE